MQFYGSTAGEDPASAAELLTIPGNDGIMEQTNYSPGMGMLMRVMVRRQSWEE